MSLSAKRFPKVVRLRAMQTLEDALFEEGFEYVAGRLNDLFYRPDQLTQEEADHIASGVFPTGWYEWHDEKFEAFISGKSRGAKYIARRIRYGAKPDLDALASDWAATKELRSWLRDKGEEFARHLDVSVPKLMHLGIRFAWQAERFCELYDKVQVSSRPWGSSYQPCQGRVKAIALTPNYNRLPLWVKEVMINSPHWIETGDRIGNVWRLIDCAKAWKHAPSLPKGIAEKVGRMSVKSRILARYAWAGACSKKGLNSGLVRQGYENDWTVVRSEVVEFFWLELRRLSKASAVQLVAELVDDYNHAEMRRLVEACMGLPHQFLFEAWGRQRDASMDKYMRVMADAGSPDEVCQHIFGNAGKLTVQLFQSASFDAWKWASVLCYGNADAVQKVLAMKEMIAYQPEAIDFLMTLPMQSRIRMLGATTFKYRGVTHPITDDHVRDTGYLWKNIQSKPELGRIRYWFSVHETLAAAFVKELPDEALPIPSGWERVDGLCAIDGSWQLEFPQRVATLKYYGEVLRNCVGGYGPAIKQGRSVIFVVREYGILTHCVEVLRESGRVQQFYTAGNRSPKYEVKESVCDSLRQAKLVY